MLSLVNKQILLVVPLMGTHKQLFWKMISNKPKLCLKKLNNFI
jgi:hypothetical protein